MWPFNLIKKIKDLEKFNEHLQKANRHLFEMYKRERFEIEAHTQDCLEEYCRSAGIDYTAIKTPQEYYEWIWRELFYLGIMSKKSDPNTGMFRSDGNTMGLKLDEDDDDPSWEIKN